MKKTLILTLILTIFSTSIFAQSKLKGKIFDEKNEGMFYVTVVLYNLPDSTIAYSLSSEADGFFKFTRIKDGNYCLKATFLGYETAFIDSLSFPRDNNKNLEVKMVEQTNEIDEVKVEGKKPLLEQQADRLVVNVADNISGASDNLMDVMKKVPGIVVMGDNISLAGATNLTILINGKTTKYMDVTSLLRDMPGDNIQKVEIIHQPGAEFDASGSGPIINIILKKNSLFGTFGTVKTGYSRAAFNRYNSSVSLNHYKGNVNIAGGLGFRTGGRANLMDITRSVRDDYYSQLSTTTSDYLNLRGNFGIDWNISEKHSVGFQSRLNSYNSEDFVLNTTDINYFADSIADATLLTTNNKDGFWRLGGVNPYYEFKIDSLGQKLVVDFNYIEFWSDNETIIKATESNSNTEFPYQKYLQPGDSKIIVGKIDYTYPITALFHLQVGAKYSLADLDNDFQSYLDLQNTDVWTNNTLESNHFLFSETIWAGYSKLSFTKAKWAGTFGLRYEDSFSEGRSVGIDTVLDRRIKKLFPSASLSRDIVAGLSGIFAYSYRLDRPRYSSLNPFRYSLDLYTYQKGNPELQPEFTHSMKFSLAFQKQPFFNVEYKLTEDAMIESIGQNDETGESYRSEINIDSKKQFNISLFFPLSFIPKTQGYGGIIVNNFQFYSPLLEEEFKKSLWNYTAFLQAEISLPWRIKAEMSGYYTSGGINGYVTYEWMYGTRFGVSRKFLHDRARITIGVDDLFNKFYTGKVEYSNIDLTLHTEWDVPVFSFQLSYNFGNKHLNRETHKSGAMDEINRTGGGE